MNSMAGFYLFITITLKKTKTLFGFKFRQCRRFVHCNIVGKMIGEREREMVPIVMEALRLFVAAETLGSFFIQPLSKPD